jgi:hypothetical protein
MVADGAYVAVLDRFEVTEAGTERAVLLLESDGRQVDQLIVERTELPANAERDTVLEITVEGDSVVDATVDETATDDRTDAAQRRFDRLARRPPDEDGDPNEGGDEPPDEDAETEE